MILKDWEDIPVKIKNKDVKKYYDLLSNRKSSLYLKRAFDLVIAILLTVVLIPCFVIISLIIKFDSKGPVFFRQVRVTQYGRKFKIYKFRTMFNLDNQNAVQVTTKEDIRVTNAGKFLRKFRIDEIPQLINIIKGEMTFVGTRPEVVRFVEFYSPEMFATLLLPAGVTSEASIHYKDEDIMLSNSSNPEEIYRKEILPAKMFYNLKSIEEFSFINEIKTILRTIKAVIS